MTSTITIDKRFGTITGMGGPNASPLIALAGPYHRILHAHKSGEQIVFLGESADLGAEVLAANNQSSPNFHVLTTAGVTIVDNANAPAIVDTFDFDPGGGRWLALFGSHFLATPLARGGVQVLHSTTGVELGKVFGSADSRFAAALVSRGYLWVADGTRAMLHTYVIDTSTGTISYINSIRAPNCRDIIKVVLDSDNGNLFVVCRRRIVRFVVPTLVVDEPLPVFAQDYGVALVDYTDFAVIGENQYWIGQNTFSAPTPLDEFRGPLFGVWDPSLGDAGELVVAAPVASLWTVNNVVPFYTEDTIGETTTPGETAPPVILPDPPVITSPLTDSTPEDEVWEYHITATGAVPITYGVIDPPDWLTDIDPLTGLISGIPPDPGLDPIIISATNAGGTTTAILELTVTPATVVLEFTATLAILQSFGPSTPFPIALFDAFDIPATRTVSEVYIQTITPLAITTDPSAGAVFSVGTNPIVEGGTQPWQNLNTQLDQSLAIGGVTNTPDPPHNLGPYSMTDPTTVKLRVGLNGSIFAAFSDLTAGELYIRITLDPP